MDNQNRSIRSFAAWLKPALLSVFIYYDLSGLLLIVAPNAPFEVLKLEPVNHPWLVQLCGILTAVFGLGFFVAARDPIRFRAFILIGMIAQIVVPAAVMFWIFQGVLPLYPSVGLVASDLFFGMVLLCAYRGSK